MAGVLDRAEQLVRQLYSTEVPSIYVYHSIQHTCEVVEASRKIALVVGVNDKDLELLTLAAWFHDTGYVKRYDLNEDVGAKLAAVFLSKEGFSSQQISMVEEMILATNLTKQPANLLQEIIRDADLAHLGRPDFFSRNELLRQEWVQVKNRAIDEQDWRDITISFLQLHTYHTSYAVENFEPRKQVHLAYLLGSK